MKTDIADDGIGHAAAHHGFFEEAAEAVDAVEDHEVPQEAPSARRRTISLVNSAASDSPLLRRDAQPICIDRKPVPVGFGYLGRGRGISRCDKIILPLRDAVVGQLQRIARPEGDGDDPVGPDAARDDFAGNGRGQRLRLACARPGDDQMWPVFVAAARCCRVRSSSMWVMSGGFRMDARGLSGGGGKGLEGFEEALGSEGGRPGFPGGEASNPAERIVIQRLDRDLEVLAQLVAKPADHVQALACRREMVGAIVLAID